MKQHRPWVVKVFGIVMILYLGIPLFGMEWPDPNAQVVENFGMPQGRVPALGMRFSSNGPIRSANSGELIFTYPSEDDHSAFPSPLGAWVALDHGDGLVGIYSRMALPQGEGTTSLIEKGALVGNAGTTGYSSQEGFSFSIYDKKEKRWVNPLMVLPPWNDNANPSIRSLILISAQGDRINPTQVRTLKQGLYRVVAELWDTLEEGSRNYVAPFRVGLTVNGTEQGALHLETLKAEQGVLRVHRIQPEDIQRVYQANFGYELGEVLIPRGKVALELSVRDASGREKLAQYTLTAE